MHKVVRIHMQARGIKRREQLKAATRELLIEMDISAITFADIALRANVPKSSAYHFYANIDEIYAEVAASYGTELLNILSVLPDYDDVEHWQDIVDILIDRSIVFYKCETAARQLIISGKTSAAIKQKDRNNDLILSEKIYHILDSFFELPQINNRSDIFHIWVEIVDVIFTLSQMKYGFITTSMANEAKRAAKAYLGTYLTASLVKKPNVIPSIVLS
ncbi:TetR family transcriptional regulator [Photobacterium sanguinicancri]|uniref:TetR family transcriptional regulator n=1 Tax=Photobacterium sanguinicancri TaxID=875932 RepID=UPI0026E44FC5|nr:TetR family transcriptional regulator [Photobacterium sanguinicancri]MDO6496726.1 TetR family transcriptional regulator [Photobacterium sanguinicancri]